MQRSGGQHGALVAAAEVIDGPHLPDGEPGREQKGECPGQARLGGGVHDQLALVDRMVETPSAQPQLTKGDRAAADTSSAAGGAVRDISRRSLEAC
jgi:hypothetical protein